MLISNEHLCTGIWNICMSTILELLLVCNKMWKLPQGFHIQLKTLHQDFIYLAYNFHNFCTWALKELIQNFHISKSMLTQPFFLPYWLFHNRKFTINFIRISCNHTIHKLILLHKCWNIILFHLNLHIIPNEKLNIIFRNLEIKYEVIVPPESASDDLCKLDWHK